MAKWVTKYLVPLLLLGGIIFLFVDFQTVVTIDPEAGRYDSPAKKSQSGGLPSQRDVPRSESRLAKGERFASLDELVADQQAAGFLRTGTFGNHWPATVIEIKTGNDGIRFVRKDGTPHNYTGFDGYRMKVVHLRASGEEETIVVFRSEEKR